MFSWLRDFVCDSFRNSGNRSFGTSADFAISFWVSHEDAKEF